MTPEQQVSATFKQVFEELPDFIIRAPGRADLLGSHTDYNKGRVLPFAIDRAAWLAVRGLEHSVTEIHAADFGETVTLSLDDLNPSWEGPGWARFAAGVAWSLQQTEYQTPGCQMVIHSDVPVGGGVSSSAAVEVGYALAWTHLTGVDMDRMKLAQICQRAENNFVGVSSGLMDQFASLHGDEGHALFFDTKTLAWEAVRVPKEAAWIITPTATSRQLAVSAYNDRVAECTEATRILKEHLPDIEALCDVNLTQFEDVQQHLDDVVRMRAKHVINEDDRVRKAVDILNTGDLISFGQLMDESFLSMRDYYEASSDELNLLWRLSHGVPGRLGGRILGAGWGGCMIFLVEDHLEHGFIDFMQQAYQQESGLVTKPYRVIPSAGAAVIE